MTFIEERIEALEAEISELKRRLALLEGQQPDLLSTAEAADLLNVHYNTVKQWIRDGKLPAEKVGRNWKIRREDVLALMPTSD